jgi:hypothetical protein
MIRSASLEQGLVNTPTTSNDTDSSACAAGDSFLCARWETNASLVLIGGVTDDGGIISRGTCECTAITKFLLDVANNGTFRTCGDRQDVANSELGLLSCIDKGARVKALCGDKGLLSELVAIGITENDTSKRGTASVLSLSWNRWGNYDGTHRPASWIISFTMPRMYPLRSA